MQAPIDAVFDGYGFDEQGEWHEGPVMDFWRWGFSDLGDAEMKGAVAELMVKMLLRAAPESMTADEMELLRVSQGWIRNPEAESGYRYDA